MNGMKDFDFDMTDGIATKIDIGKLEVKIARLDERVGELATKKEIEEFKGDLKVEIADVKSDLKEDIGKVESGLKVEIADVKSDLKEDIGKVESGLKVEVADVKNDLKWIKWLLAGAIALIPTIGWALLRLWPGG